SIRDPDLVPRVGLFGAHGETDRATVGVSGRLAINGFGHQENPAVVRVNQPTLSVLDAGLTAHCAKQRIVKFLRSGNVVASNHNMAKHSVPSLPKSLRLPPSQTNRTRFTSGEKSHGDR